MTDTNSPHMDHPLAPHFLRVAPAVWRFIAREIPSRLRSKIQPDDILQETFVDALRCPYTERLLENNTFEPWLMHVAKRTLQDKVAEQLRLKRGGGTLELQASQLDTPSSVNLFNELVAPCRTPRSEVEKNQVAQKLREGMKMLPPEEFEVIEHYHFKGYGLPQISELMQIPYQETRNLYMRAIRHLRDYLIDISGIWSASNQ